MVEYAERFLGYAPRLTKEKLRVATRLERLPKLRERLLSGATPWSAVREITRVATKKNEDEWLAATDGKTVREVERLVAGKRLGDRPSDPPDPLLARHRVVSDLSAQTFALLGDALDHARRMIGPNATHDEAMRAILEGFLGRSRDLREPAYEISVTLCAQCNRTWQHAAGEAIEVPESVGECAKCDGEIAGVTTIDPDPDPDPHPDSETHVGRPELDPIRELVRRRGVGGLVSEVSRTLGLDHKTLSPKLRGIVLSRDRHRCSVPGCTNRLFLQIHHLNGRRHRGCHSPDETILICSTHHERHHEGVLAIEGSPSTGLVFRHANGTLYGAPIVNAA
jgi:hypothetical protein